MKIWLAGGVISMSAGGVTRQRKPAWRPAQLGYRNQCHRRISGNAIWRPQKRKQKAKISMAWQRRHGGVAAAIISSQLSKVMAYFHHVSMACHHQQSISSKREYLYGNIGNVKLKADNGGSICREIMWRG
jgi:hypothetical protein